MGLTATSAAKRSSGAATTPRTADGGADHGRDPRGRSREHATAARTSTSTGIASAAANRRRARAREHERLGLRPAEQSEPSPCEPSPGDHPHLQHEHAGGGRRGERHARHQASDEQLSIDPGAPALHPDAQAGGLVVLELEQMQHEMEPPGDQDEQAKTGER